MSSSPGLKSASIAITQPRSGAVPRHVARDLLELRHSSGIELARTKHPELDIPRAAADAPTAAPCGSRGPRGENERCRPPPRRRGRARAGRSSGRARGTPRRRRARRPPARARARSRGSAAARCSRAVHRPDRVAGDDRDAARDAVREERRAIVARRSTTCRRGARTARACPSPHVVTSALRKLAGHRARAASDIATARAIRRERTPTDPKPSRKMEIGSQSATGPAQMVLAAEARARRARGR